MVPNGFQHISGLGNFPSDWQVMSADCVTTKITKGTTPPKSEIVQDSNIPFLRVNNLSFNGRLNTSSEMLFVSRNAHEGFLSRSIAYPDDILMNIVGPPLGKISMLDNQYDSYNMNQAIVIYRTSPEQIDKYYFLKFLTSELAQQWLQSRSKKTSGQQNLTIQLCKELPIPVPPLSEQRKIAKILSTWDKAISTTERLIDNSKQQKKALMQQLLTGKKRLLDDSGKPFEGDWEEVKLGDLLTESTQRNKNNAIQRVLSVTNHSGFVLPEEQFSKRVASNNVTNYKIVKKGEYGYNPSRINVGSFARLELFDEGILSPMYVVFRLNKSKLNSDYFLNWMSSNEASQRVIGSTQGSVRDSVGFGTLCGFPFKLPNIKEQQKIASVLINADKEIELLQQQLSDLKQEKKALMQQLLTGKRRVKVNDKEVA